MKRTDADADDDAKAVAIADALRALETILHPPRCAESVRQWAADRWFNREIARDGFSAWRAYANAVATAWNAQREEREPCSRT